MPQDVAPQVDVGLLSMSGLTALAPLLSALSADDVAPMALVQLNNLGTVFRVNGEYARMLPDLLRRCSSTRLDRLGLIIGWSKGDAASVMAQSAAGQAIALLCFCLTNTCKPEDVGGVLSDLGDLIFPDSLTRSSVMQLTRVADTLSSKLQTIGFGNILAKLVIRIQDAYRYLGKKLPPEFFDPMSRESMVEFYHALSKLSIGGNTVLRISGVYAMAHIIMTAVIMFPNNVMVTAENVILQCGSSPSIYLDVNVSDPNNLLTTIHVEERLNDSILHSILRDDQLRILDKHQSGLHHFRWENHVTDALRIGLAIFGWELPDALIQACCDLVLVWVTTRPLPNHHVPHPMSSTFEGYASLLGSEPAHRCYEQCKTVFGVAPRACYDTVESVSLHLNSVVQSLLGPDPCCVSDEKIICDLPSGMCESYDLWRMIRRALFRAYSVLLIDAERDASITFDILSAKDHLHQLHSHGEVSSIWPVEIAGHFTTSQGIHWEMLTAISGPCLTGEMSNSLACSSGSSTIYPAALKGLELDFDVGVRYILASGQIFFRNRRCWRLDSVKVERAVQGAGAISSSELPIKPAAYGEHSSLEFSIRESLATLQLCTIAAGDGVRRLINLTETLLSRMTLRDAPACAHSPMAELSPKWIREVVLRSVMLPISPTEQLAITQTRGNRTAQLLACEPNSNPLLQRKCCLDCAVEYAKANGFRCIIVGC